jgi:hypothetical protein
MQLGVTKRPTSKINVLNLHNLSKLMYIQLVYRLKDRTIQEMLLTLRKLPISVDILSYWIRSIETTAKNMCDDNKENIIFEYTPENPLKYYVKDSKSRDCLVRSVEIHLPLIPELLQGFFYVFKYNLKNIKFDSQ